jgi:non-specific protein-tyrosine kinase
VEINDYLRALRKRWRILVACVAMGVGVGAAIISLTTPEYEATAQLFVSANDTGGLASDLQQGAEFSQDRVESYAEIINSPQITEPVASQLKVGLTGKEISAEISADAPPNTVLVNMHVTDTSALRAQRLANAVSQQFATYAANLEASADSATPPVKVTVVKYATLPSSPASPKSTLDLSLGLLVGLMLGVGGSVLREKLDNTVKSPEDVLEATARPAIGVIAYDPEAKDHPLIVAQHPHSTRAEAFRQLRTNLQFVDVDSAPRSIVFTSSVPNEGKTTTVCNLAITLAQAGARVIVIEADLRRPRLGEYLGLDNAVGLTSVLVGTTSLEDATQQWGSSGLAVLASGPLPPNPSEMLSSHAMVDLLRRLEDDYDLVLLDAPPLLPVTDAAVIAAATSGAVLIARHGSTKRDQLARSAETLTEGVGARILGCVINMTPKRGPDSYYYGYAYSYDAKSKYPEKARSAPNSVGQAANVLPKTPMTADAPLHTSVVMRTMAPGSNGDSSSQPATAYPADTPEPDFYAGDLEPIITERPSPPTPAHGPKPDVRERLRGTSEDSSSEPLAEAPPVEPDEEQTSVVTHDVAPSSNGENSPPPSRAQLAASREPDLYADDPEPIVTDRPSVPPTTSSPMRDVRERLTRAFEDSGAEPLPEAPPVEADEDDAPSWTTWSKP